MNQDFFIPAKAGLARRLVKLASISNIDLDPTIVELSRTGFLSPEPFEKYSLLPSQWRAIQMLRDYDFRACIPGNFRLTAEAVLIAAKELKIFPVFVVSERKLWWQRMAAAIDFPTDQLFTYEFKHLEEFDYSIFKDRRQGLFIGEDSFGLEQWHNIGHYAFDFPKTVFLSKRKDISDISEAHYLSPKAPTELLKNAKNGLMKRKLSLMGFSSSADLSDYAFLYNIINCLVSDETRRDIIGED